MAEHDPQSKEQPQEKEHQEEHQEEHRHEESDVNINLILKISGGFVVVLVLIHLIILGMYAALAQYAWETQPKLSPLVKKEQIIFPKDLDAIPQPRLQITEKEDWQKLEKQQRAKLEGYHWVDPEKKDAVRIPIERAIQLLADSKQQEDRGIQTEGKK